MKASRGIVFGIVVAAGLACAQGGPIRVGGNVQQANIVSRVTPVYPADAKRDRVQGTVKLEVTINKEGHVASASVLEGPPVLVQSAVDAVLQWVYRPTLLNGQPVDVITTVDVNYTLAQ
jgi:periplasmic protein TonB